VQFWFVRHGESCHNAAGLFCGSIDSPLTEKGYQQADRVSRFFVDKACDWIATSPLSRAHDTARLIAKHQGLQLIIDERLSEHAKGSMENTKHRKMKSRKWSEVADAEPLTDFYDRVFQSLSSLRHCQGTGIVVSHAGVARAVEAVATQTQPNDLYDLKKVKNAQPKLFVLPDELF
jgi:broad specificity phosphatase PhoE